MNVATSSEKDNSNFDKFKFKPYSPKWWNVRCQILSIVNIVIWHHIKDISPEIGNIVQEVNLWTATLYMAIGVLEYYQHVITTYINLPNEVLQYKKLQRSFDRKDPS